MEVGAEVGSAIFFPFLLLVFFFASEHWKETSKTRRKMVQKSVNSFMISHGCSDNGCVMSCDVVE